MVHFMAIFHDTFDIVYYETLPVFHSLQETRHRVPITTNTDHQMARKVTNKHFGVGGVALEFGSLRTHLTGVKY